MDGLNWFYSPFDGVVILKPDWDMSGHYECVATRNKTTSRESFNIGTVSGKIPFCQTSLKSR